MQNTKTANVWLLTFSGGYLNGYTTDITRYYQFWIDLAWYEDPKMLCENVSLEFQQTGPYMVSLPDWLSLVDNTWR